MLKLIWSFLVAILIVFLGITAISLIGYVFKSVFGNTSEHSLMKYPSEHDSGVVLLTVSSFVVGLVLSIVFGVYFGFQL